MAMVRVDIETVVIGGGPVASLVVLKPRRADSIEGEQPLPIRIGTVEASAIGMGVESPAHERPMTHDLLKDTIRALGSTVSSVAITKVEGTTFYAQVNLTTEQGDHLSLDARPSDAIALAVRTKSPIFVAEAVMDAASYPDFAAIGRDEEEKSMEEFHDFVENLSPDDFAAGDRP